jgi:hypothetical protein
MRIWLTTPGTGSHDRALSARSADRAALDVDRHVADRSYRLDGPLAAAKR